MIEKHRRLRILHSLKEKIWVSNKTNQRANESEFEAENAQLSRSSYHREGNGILEQLVIDQVFMVFGVWKQIVRLNGYCTLHILGWEAPIHERKYI